MRRSTEGGEAPGWQGATTENIGHMRGRSNAASRDASPAECRRIYEMSSRISLEPSLRDGSETLEVKIEVSQQRGSDRWITPRFYEVVARLGAGGMGEVYRARDTKLGLEPRTKGGTWEWSMVCSVASSAPGWCRSSTASSRSMAACRVS